MAAESAASTLVGRTLGSVTLLSVLGTGQSGTVFVGFQRTLRRQVAVKVLFKNEVAPLKSPELFQREAELVAGLSHPNIVAIHEMGEEQDCYYLVMQLVRGDDLQELIERRLRNPVPSRQILPLVRSLEIGIGILEGLDHAHREGVLHQDIKPANIRIDRKSGRAMITDFGIARTVRGRSAIADGTIVGTPLYIAPECIGGAGDARSDLYSAGVTLFHALAGRLPLADMEPVALLRRKLEAPESVFVQRPSACSPVIDQQLEAVLLRAMAPAPGERYRTCAEAADELRRCLQTYRRRHPAPRPADLESEE